MGRAEKMKMRNCSWAKIHNCAENSSDTTVYYYDVARDCFTNNFAWVNQDEQIDAIIIDANSSAQDIDVIFADLYPR